MRHPLTPPIAIVILGAPNTADGRLLPVALSRAETAVDLHMRLLGGADFILTGGFGAHFNSSDRPHWHYLKDFLIEHHVNPESIVACLDTGNTLDDIAKVAALPRLDRYAEILLVTSDFHVGRVSLLANRLLRHPHCVIAARTPPSEPYADLVDGEYRRIRQLLLGGEDEPQANSGPRP
jgi:uncharacterized SAM-binding protein YcdF (DUF218 family)